jgi:hypothetical protein
MSETGQFTNRHGDVTPANYHEIKPPTSRGENNATNKNHNPINI